MFPIILGQQTSSTTLASWATVIATVIGPLIGVYVAYVFSRRQSQRQAAAELFRRIAEDAKNYEKAASTANFANLMIGGTLHTSQMTPAEEHFHNEAKRLHAVGAMLHADIVSIRLIFLWEGDQLIEAIKSLLSLGDLVNQKPQQFEEKLSQAFDSIVSEIEDLRLLI
jgi:hypothetical protein